VRPPAQTGSWNLVSVIVRWLAREKALRVLRAIQPSSGGYLEGDALTSFVTLSLASIGHASMRWRKTASAFWQARIARRQLGD